MKMKINCSTCKYVILDTILYSNFDPDYCCFGCKKNKFTPWIDLNLDDLKKDKFLCAEWEEKDE